MEQLFALCLAAGDGNHGQAVTRRVKHLLKKHPRAARARNLLDQLPLHVAASNGASAQILECLVKAYPESIRIKGYAGRLALHEACYEHASVQAIQFLVHANPSALHARDDWDRLPLHCACSANASLDTLKILYQGNPDAIMEKDSTNRLPLHYACCRWTRSNQKGCIEKLRFLLDAYPEASKVPCASGCLPLHLLCANMSATAPREAIELVVSAWPRAIQLQNDKGFLPLDLWLLNNNNKEEVDALVGKEPVHFVCLHSTSVATVEHFVSKDPQSPGKKSSKGKLPLHCAALNSSPNKRPILDALLKDFPLAIESVDPEGLLPVHALAQSDSPLGDIFDMLKQYPEAIL